MITRFAQWYDAHPVAGDAGLAGMLLLAFALPTDLAAKTDTAAGLAFSCALLACVPLRRRAPVAVFAAVSALCLVQLVALDRIVAGDVAALIALYTLVAYGPGARLAAVATACTVAGALAAAVRWDTPGDGVSLLEVAASTVGSTLLAATLGAWRGARRAQVATLHERNRLLALERDQQAAAGAASERARIARELHDVVAHSLSVIVVQADGAAAAAEQRPAAAAAALRTIGDTGRDSLGQMRRLLGVLRDRADDDAALAPQPGTAQLDALVAQVVRAGLPARLSVGGPPRPVAAPVDLTLYRVAQEALTNVLKHAGEVSRVDVVLRYDDAAVELLVRDDGRGGRGAGDGAGHGLAGMRERVDLQDGALAAGPAAGGGFEVHAVTRPPRRRRRRRHERADLPRRRPGAGARRLPHAHRGAAGPGGRRRGRRRARRAGGAGGHAGGPRADGRPHARSTACKATERRLAAASRRPAGAQGDHADHLRSRRARVRREPAGASRFLLKDARPEESCRGAIRTVARGRRGNRAQRHPPAARAPRPAGCPPARCPPARRIRGWSC